MSRKKEAPKPEYTGPVYPLESTCQIKRPHLWAGCVGEVVQVKFDGWHRIKIPAKDRQSFFHADVLGTELEPEF